jgi:2-polyprenyl-6-methoxyphenol hydroxylase-like FAD-dependent oxidoreductase
VVASPGFPGGARRSLLARLERRLSRPIPTPQPIRRRDGLPPGTRIAVIGGGVAGTAFVRRLLTLSRQSGRPLDVTLLDQIDCNYCAGLMTRLARETLRSLYDLEVPEELILTRVDHCVYLNRYGGITVRVDEPLITMLRTERFGEVGFDDSFKYRILEGLPGVNGELHVLDPASATEIIPPSAGRPGRVRYRERGHLQTLEADVIVVATGLRSLERQVMQDFIARTDYQPPPLMPASVTEVDASDARLNRLGDTTLIADSLLAHGFASVIPKRPNWVTVTSLQTSLDRATLDALFAEPALRAYIDLPLVSHHLRCRVVCQSRVFTGPARRFYGDGWLLLGDLTGYGRVLKDGYFAALVGADLAANCLINYGASAAALARHYHRPLRHHFGKDNAVGMFLFRMNDRLGRRAWFGRWFMTAAQAEEAGDPRGGPLHAAVRAILTGELSYAAIGLLIVAGLLRFAVTRPRRWWRCLRPSPPRPSV